jgi:hypothetical protein
MRPHQVFAFLALLSVAAPAAYADEASKAQKVEEFFQVARLEQMFSQSMSLATNQMKSSVVRGILGGLDVPPERQKLFEEMQSEVEKVLMSAMSWEQLRPEYLKLYSDAFTEEQLDDLLVFYESPTGRAMVDKTPLLMQKGGEIAQQRIASVQPDLRRVMEEFKERARSQ